MIEKKILPKSSFEKLKEPQFEDNFDYCLITPIGDNLEMTYFNITDRNVIMLKYSANELNIIPESSVLFCLTKASELMPPNLGCFVAMKN